MTNRNARPLSPHLSIWRWGPNMTVSILNRITGVGLAVVGGIIFAWWLLAAAMGEQAYATFMDVFTVESGAINIIGAIFGIGLTWSFFLHLFNGLRHFVLDTGAGYELKLNNNWSLIVILASIIMTGIVWVWVFYDSVFGGVA